MKCPNCNKEIEKGKWFSKEDILEWIKILVALTLGYLIIRGVFIN